MPPQSLKRWEKLWSTSNHGKQQQQHSSRTVATTDSKTSDEEDSGSTNESPSSALSIPEMVIADSSNNRNKHIRSKSYDRLELSKLMVQAETALNAGELRKSLVCYEQIIELLSRKDDDDKAAVAMANVCYTSSRIAKRLGDFQAAYRYTAMELSCVRHCAGNSVIACNHSELAQMCHFELGDSERALQHYKIALGLHCVRLQECRRNVAKCCRQCICAEHKAAAEEIKASIQETKESIGRIQFGMGMVADALKML